MYDERSAHDSGAPLLANPAPAFDPYPSLSSAIASLSTGNDAENDDDDHLVDLPMPPGMEDTSIRAGDAVSDPIRVKSDDDDLLQIEDAVAVDNRTLGFSRGTATPPPGDDDDHLLNTAGYLSIGPTHTDNDGQQSQSASYGYMDLPASTSHAPETDADNDTHGNSGAFGYATLEPADGEAHLGPPHVRAASSASVRMQHEHEQRLRLQQQPQTFTRPLTFAGGGLPEDFLRLMEPIQVPIGNTLGDGDGGGSGFLPKSGILTIHVAQAKLTKNYGIMRMAPYVRVSQGAHVVSSPVSMHGAKHPFWNHTMNLFVPALTDLSVKVEVLSMGTFSDRLVGWTDVSIVQALQGKRMENWFHLSGKQGVDKEGVLQLTLTFQPARIQDFPRGATTPQPYGYPPAASSTERYYGVPPHPHTPTYGQPPPGPPHHAHTGLPVGIPVAQPGSMQRVPPLQQMSPAPYLLNPPPPQQQPVIGVPVHGAPQRESSAPRVSRESVTQLKDMFPSFDDTVLESVLTSARGNVEEAINTLLSMS